MGTAGKPTVDLSLGLREQPPTRDEVGLFLTRRGNEIRDWGKRMVDNMRRRWTVRYEETAPVATPYMGGTINAQPWEYVRYGTGVNTIFLPDPKSCQGASVLLEPTGGALARAVTTGKGLMDGYDELPAYGEFVSHLGKWVRLYLNPHWTDPKLAAVPFNGDPTKHVEVRSGPINGNTYVTTGAESFIMSVDLHELINLDAVTKVTCISVEFTVFALESIYTPCWGMMRATGLYDWSPTGRTMGLVDTTPTDQRLVIGKADFKADGPYMYAYSPLENRYVRAYVSQNIHVDGAPPAYPVLTWVLKTEATYVGIPTS